MLKIMISETGKIIGEIEIPFNGHMLDGMRNIISSEYGARYSLVWEI